ncbi:MAG: hypothetical protein ABJC09_10885 [Terriglobia bacterium]
MRASAYQPEFGLLGAGAVGASLAGRLLTGVRSLGPVAAVSYRVASRIANSLKAGLAARSADELESVRTVLFYSPAGQMQSLLEVLVAADVQWVGKSLVFCDCQAGQAAEAHFRDRGASVAGIRNCPIPGRLVIDGAAPALLIVRGMARQLSMKYIELGTDCGDFFQAAMTLGSAALTPLIDLAADLLRKCGVRDGEAPLLAAALFQETIKDYSHSGKQSWAWYAREPELHEIEAQTADGRDHFEFVLRDLIILGLERFDKHPAAAARLRSAGRRLSEIVSIPDAKP